MTFSGLRSTRSLGSGSPEFPGQPGSVTQNSDRFEALLSLSVVIGG